MFRILTIKIYILDPHAGQVVNGEAHQRQGAVCPQTVPYKKSKNPGAMSALLACGQYCSVSSNQKVSIFLLHLKFIRQLSCF